MKRILILLIGYLVLIGLTSCGGDKGKLALPDSLRYTDQDIPLDEISSGSVNTDSILVSDKMRKLFSPADSLIEGKPASYYLNRSDVSQTAKDYYLLRFIPTDSEPTFALWDSLLTLNDTTRPFYYFLFLRMGRIADGGVAEGMAEHAANYSLKFVDEFYRRLHLPQYKWSYSSWADNLAFSLYGSSNDSSAEKIRAQVITMQMKNAKNLTPSLKKDIRVFADSVVKAFHHLQAPEESR